MSDRVLGASAGDSGFIVRVAETTALCEAARRIHGTSPTATAALGRGLTGALLLGSLLKGNQSILLQWRGGGPLGPVVTEGRPDLSVRGYAARPAADLPARNGKLDVGGAVGKEGELVVVKDLGLREPYTSTVRLQSGEMGDDLAYYLMTSEQIPSAVGLGVFVAPDYSVETAGGVLVEALPGGDPEVLDRLADNMASLSSVTEVLRKDGLEGLLGRVMRPLPFRVLDLGEPVFRCSCGPDRLDRVLVALGPEEVESLFREEGEVRARCAFCAGEWRKRSPDAHWERLG